jgi:hypothetical protein
MKERYGSIALQIKFFLLLGNVSDMLLFDLFPNFGYETVQFYNFLNYGITFSFKTGSHLVSRCYNF